MSRHVFLLVLVSLAAAGAPGAALAQNAGDSAVISGGQVTGDAMVNVAAGSLNQQLNAGVLANGGDSRALAAIGQTTGDALDSAGPLNSQITPGSFAGSTGLMAVNGAAGAGNQQANIAMFAIGTTGVALGDIALSQARASQGPSGSQEQGTTAGERSVAIGDGAFAGSSGLVQVSLIGGDRNSSANTFALSSIGGTNP